MDPTEGNKIAPVRSSSALVLSSTNANRERIYVQQPPIAASGYSSQAMNPHYPHTERKTETKTCSDCHLAKNGDNNAIVAQTLGFGTQFINFLGFHAYVGAQGSVTAVQVTEWEEPQAVIGSYLASIRLSEVVRRSREAQQASARRRSEERRRSSVRCSCAASTSTSPKARTACASTTSRASATRA